MADRGFAMPNGWVPPPPRAFRNRPDVEISEVEIERMARAMAEADGYYWPGGKVAPGLRSMANPQRWRDLARAGLHAALGE